VLGWRAAALQRAGGRAKSGTPPGAVTSIAAALASDRDVELGMLRSVDALDAQQATAP